MLKGPVWSQSWALFQTDQAPVRSKKFPKPKNCKKLSEPVCGGPGLNVIKSDLNPQKHIVRINYSLTFYVNFKPIIIKIGWELDRLWYILWMSKIWCATFAVFTVFFFSQPVFIQFGWKKYQNLAKVKGYTTTDLVQSEPFLTGPRTTVFFSPCLNEMKGPDL